MGLSIIRGFAIAIICLFFSGPLLAADLPLPRTPIYDPHSKSYFQIFDDNVHPGNWEAARSRAGMKAYKGVRGRLAVIDSAETQKFLLRAFDLDRRHISVWIGLPTVSSARLLKWDDGRPSAPCHPHHFRLCQALLPPN